MSKTSKHVGSIALLTAAVMMSFSPLAISQGAPMPMSAEQLAEAAMHKVIVAGDSLIVDKTTALKTLKIENGAAVAAPAGHSLTMTVDGVETGIVPGKYKGKIVLTVTDEHAVKFSETLIHHFRQALMLDKDGVVAAKSVTAAAGPYALKDGVLTGANIKSTGENFNGILVTGGHYTLKNVVLDLKGNGGNDFAGYGAGIMSDGKDTTLVLDGAKVTSEGAVRTTVICNGGSNLIVKNSEIHSKGGKLPSDYVSNVTPGEMKDAPWMLGITGNVRATNVLGDNTTCTYLNSHLTSTDWGVLSVDASQNIFLTAINSKIELTGKAGYGTYAIGNSTNMFYGSTVKVPTHAAIITDGHLVMASSSKENMAKLNTELKLGLSAAELAAVKPAETVINSDRFGVMIWGNATVKVADATIVNTGEATILNKGSAITVDVDGSKGAQLNTKNGIIYQGIDNDDPGPVMVDGLMANTGVYKDPTEAPKKVADFDLTTAHATDAVLNFSKITLKGDFYNAIRSKSIGGGMGPNGPSNEPPKFSGANLVLNLNDSNVSGVISAASAKHVKNPITPADYEYLGEVKNTVGAAINNGVIVNLKKSTWTVKGNSYLTSLTIGAGSSVTAPKGKKLTMKVNGVVTPVREGNFKGNIALQVAG